MIVDRGHGQRETQRLHARSALSNNREVEGI